MPVSAGTGIVESFSATTKFLACLSVVRCSSAVAFEVIFETFKFFSEFAGKQAGHLTEPIGHLVKSHKRIGDVRGRGRTLRVSSIQHSSALLGRIYGVSLRSNLGATMCCYGAVP